MTLQPHASKPIDHQTAKTIWIALTGSILMYGGVLIFLGKITSVAFPSLDQHVFAQLSLILNIMFLLSYTLYSKKVLKMKDSPDKFGLQIACWALNEFPVVMAFAATMVVADGNGFYYGVNAILAICMNLVMFPRK